MEAKDWFDIKSNQNNLELRIRDEAGHLARVVKVNRPVDGTLPYQVSVQIFEGDPDRGHGGLKEVKLHVKPEKDVIDASQGVRVGQIIVE